MTIRLQGGAFHTVVHWTITHSGKEPLLCSCCVVGVAPARVLSTHSLDEERFLEVGCLCVGLSLVVAIGDDISSVGQPLTDFTHPFSSLRIHIESDSVVD